MKHIQLGKSGITVPAVAVGCMRVTRLSTKEANRFYNLAIDNGANFFDHADIYGGGKCESAFAEALPMNEDMREKIILQSKCGIVSGKRYDFSKKHILESVDASLKRLNTSYLDVLLLHRPDALVEPEEVAEAFNILQDSGKVRAFGVSNHSPYQIQLLQKHMRQPIVANQLQFSVAHATMVTAGMHVNMNDDAATDRDGGILDFCRLNDITIQPWSPFQHGFFGGVFLDNADFPELNKTIDEKAEKYGVSNTTMAMAWILRHPAKMQPVTGTMNETRLLDCIKAADVVLDRQDWYDILLAAGNTLP